LHDGTAPEEAVAELVERTVVEDARLLDVDDERRSHSPPAQIGADELGGAQGVDRTVRVQPPERAHRIDGSAKADLR